MLEKNKGYQDLLKTYINGDVEIINIIKEYRYRGRIKSILLKEEEELTINLYTMIQLINGKWAPLFESKYHINLHTACIIIHYETRLIIKTEFKERIEFFTKNESPFKWDPFTKPTKIDDYDKLLLSNLLKSILEIPHMELERYGNSIYKSVCPVCHKGLLLVRRHQETLIFEEYDSCVLCGQRIRYLDINNLRKRNWIE